MSDSRTPHHVVVVGGGFGGLHAVKSLRRHPVRVTLIDRRNFHLFQPLTYQIATGALSPGDVTYPLRALFRGAPNVDVMLAEVTGIDLSARRVTLTDVPGMAPASPASLTYDTLIVAAGSTYSYFGHDEWREHAAEVKTLESAIVVRSRILRAFERAELLDDPEGRRAEMTFVVVGGGPTGVEMAGQIAELARDTLRRDFRAIDPRETRVILVDSGPRILHTFPPSLSERAAAALRRLGVTVLTQTTVTGVDASGVDIAGANGAQRLPSATVVWAAGVTASGVGRELAEASGAELDHTGRLSVEPDLTLPGHPEVIVLGDMVRVRDAAGTPQTLPGVAPVAIQQGRHAARVVSDRLARRATRPFRYRDKGNVATIGRNRAVADLRVIRLSGSVAWLVWLAVHLWYLIGFRNRLLVLIQWSISFLTHGRGARLIDDPS